MLEIIIDSEFDDAKYAKLIEKRHSELFNNQVQQKQLWNLILLALDLEDLQSWTREVTEKRAVMYKAEQEKKKKAKEERGFFGYFWGGNDTKDTKTTKAETEALSSVEQLLNEVKA